MLVLALATACSYAPGAAPVRAMRAAPRPVAMVASWYDAGVRLDGVDLETENAALKEELERLRAQLEAQTTAEAEESAPTAAPAAAPVTERRSGMLQDMGRGIVTAAKKATAIPDEAEVAKDVSTAVALLSGVGAFAAMGATVAELDADLLALGLGASAAVIAEEDEGLAGRSLRAVGKVATPVLKTTAEAAKTAADYAEENDLGWKARALLEMGVEAAVRSVKKAPKA